MWGVAYGYLANTINSNGVYLISVIGAIAIAIFGIISLLSGICAIKSQKIFDEQVIKSNIRDVDLMSGREFESYLAALYKKLGFKTEITKAIGDYGVDLLLYQDNVKIIVQAKCYKNKVTIKAVQEIAAARTYYHTNNAMVVTNNYFTQPAITLAQSNGIKLVNRDDLIKLICTVNAREITVEPKIETAATTTTFSTTSQKPQKTPLQIIKENELNDYNNAYSNKIVSIKNKILEHYSSSDMEIAKQCIVEAENIERLTEQNNISLHFFYAEVADIIYAYRYERNDALDYCLEICKKDMEIGLKTPHLAGCTYKTLTRQAIIFEKKKQYDKALGVCDYGIKHNYLDNGKSFEIRKQKIIKKMQGEENKN